MNFRFIDRVLKNPRRRILKDMETGEIKEYEIQDDEDNVEENGTKFIAENMELFKQSILETIFYIGSTYVTEEAEINPVDVLGFGEWERFKARVALGIDESVNDFSTKGKLGGEVKHKLTIAELAKHGHSFARAVLWFGETLKGAVQGNNKTVESQWTEPWTGTVGEDQAHNNMQPYEIVGYMWIRRA